MADQQLTDLPVASTLTGSEVVYGVQSGDSVQMSTNQIKSFVISTDPLPRGTFSSSVTQTIANVANAQAITYNLSIDNVGITTVNNSKLTVQNTGSFVLSFSAIAHNSGAASAKTVNIFMKKNGVTVNNSSTIVSVVKNQPATVVATFVVEATDPADYWELFLAANDSNCELLATPAQAAVPDVSPAQPACPSIIVAMWEAR